MAGLYRRLGGRHRGLRRARRTAFTLVELLVVIGILAILMGILVPALTKTREQANAIKCSANLRSIGQAVQAYVYANDGYFAPGRNWEKWDVPNSNPRRQIDPNDDQAYWGVFYANAAKMSREMFSCPSVLQKDETLDKYKNQWSSYGLNAWGNGPSGMNDTERQRYFQSTTLIALFRKGSGWDNSPDPGRMSRVKSPSQTIICQDSWETELDGGRNGDTFASIDAGNRGRLSEYPGHDIEVLRHANLKASNVLFVDGHVEAMTKEQQTDERYYTGNWNVPRSY
jgi:prepilin-type processing-associated H-X9-DG protein/prepilin-type N-terminal cleavage/methylation domain-containing protein